jgi:transglutaminase-like putative cysteine protease
MSLSIQTRIDYDFFAPTDVLLQLEAAIIPEQRVIEPHIAISPVEHFARLPGHDAIGERISLRLSGRLSVDYSATVEIERQLADIATLDATPMHLLPGPAVEYLLPSHYCPSDGFLNLVECDFGDTAGGARIVAIADWIANAFTYAPGSSFSTTDAMQSYIERRGVCRDYAHVLITMARASSIPARFASVYAPDVKPQDFHAVAEVFLDGAWHLIDPTGMASPGEMAKIGVGRDAADVAFLTSFGPASLVSQTVEVLRR